MVEIMGEGLTVEQLVDVARNGVHVGPLGEAVRVRMERVHQWVMDTLSQEGRVIYGVNTGFGSLATTRIARE